MATLNIEQMPKDERRFFLAMEEAWNVRPEEWMETADVARRIGVTAERMNAILSLYHSRTLFECTYESDKIMPLPSGIDVARAIRAYEAKSSRIDWVNWILVWARRKRTLAFLIVIFRVLIPLAALAGCILGIVANVRSC